MIVPYLDPSNFQSVDLQDANNNAFGSLNLCTDPSGSDYTQWEIPSPPSSSVALPGTPSTVVYFPDVFAQAANGIGQLLAQMNRSLLNLHKTTAASGSVNGINSQTTPNTDYLNYCAAVSHLLQMLGWISGSNNGKQPKYWPLVEFNKNSTISIPVPGPGYPSSVTTMDLKNKNFPDPPSGAPPSPPNTPDNKKAMYFYVTVPVDFSKDASGSIVFYQDCEWPTSPPNDKSWVSWGFVTGFALNLYEEVVLSLGLTAGISSSCSSSLYAASSSLPSL